MPLYPCCERRTPKKKLIKILLITCLNFINELIEEGEENFLT